MGPGIQGNQLKLIEPELFVFQIRHSAVGFFDDAHMRNYAEILGAKCVPLIYRGVSLPLTFLQEEIADCQCVDGNKPAEGIVIRPHPPIAFGNGRPAGFKIINRNYGE